jgi:hypothetical protein
MNKNILFTKNILNINYYNILDEVAESENIEKQAMQRKLFDFDDELKSNFKNRVSKYEIEENKEEVEEEEKEFEVITPLEAIKPKILQLELTAEELRERQRKQREEEEIKRQKRIAANTARAERKQLEEKKHQEKLRLEAKRNSMRYKPKIKKICVEKTETKVEEFDVEEFVAMDHIFYFYHGDLYNTFFRSNVKKLENELGIYLCDEVQEKVGEKKFDIAYSFKHQISEFIESVKLMSMESVFVYRFFALLDEADLYELRLCSMYRNFIDCFLKYRRDFDELYDYVDFFYPRYIDHIRQELIPCSLKDKSKETVCRELKKGKCDIKDCRYAHNIEEYIPVDCSYGHDCKFMLNKNKPCKFRHPDETKEGMLKRLNLKFPKEIVPVKFTSKIAPWAINMLAETKTMWSSVIKYRISLKDVMYEQKLESGEVEYVQEERKSSPTHDSERTKAFELLNNNRDTIVKSITKTKLCNNMLKGCCTKSNCSFAHHYNEMSYCIFGTSCKKTVNGKPCLFRHPSETASEFSARTGITIPDNMMDKDIPKKAEPEAPKQVVKQTEQVTKQVVKQTEESLKQTRTKAFEILNSDNVSECIVKTKLCNFMMTKGCNKPSCKFAHRYGEMSYCAFGDSCRYKSHRYNPCLFRHPGESGLEFSARTGINIPANMLN